jgi:hypothetical protein
MVARQTDPDALPADAVNARKESWIRTFAIIFTGQALSLLGVSRSIVSAGARCGHGCSRSRSGR